MKKYTSVLGLARTGLVFFTAAHMVLCFRYVIKPALITHQSSGFC